MSLQFDVNQFTPSPQPRMKQCQHHAPPCPRRLYWVAMQNIKDLVWVTLPVNFILFLDSTVTRYNISKAIHSWTWIILVRTFTPNPPSACKTVTCIGLGFRQNTCQAFMTLNGLIILVCTPIIDLSCLAVYFQFQCLSCQNKTTILNGEGDNLTGMYWQTCTICLSTLTNVVNCRPIKNSEIPLPVLLVLGMFQVG